MFLARKSMPQLLPILLYAGCFFLSLPLHAPRRVATASPPISFSFDFTNKTSYNSQDLLVQGDAHVGSSMVDLTCNTVDTSKMLNCMGRVSYGRPVPLYDTTTGEVASFNTRFTFNITLVPRRSKGDGMAFFLASYRSPSGSVLPPDSYGGAFGLMSGRAWQASGEDRFVAVEFDTYNNTDFEPVQTMDHIGIDLNSVKDSVNTTNLPEFSLNGTMKASINFNGSSRMLVARLYFVDRPSMKPVEVSAQLPQLDTLLPPEVAVGFSAATGAGMELHQILSWSFNSTLAPKEQSKSIGTGLIAAAIAGGAFAFLLVVWFILSWFMSKRGRNSLKVSGAGPRQFQYNDLAKATNNFSSDRKLGEGGFGAVYRGTSFRVDKDGEQHEVAVKEILKGSKEGTKSFLAELNTISRTKHKNLVRLEGWCCYSGRRRCNWMCWCCSLKQLDDHKLFLVYELMPRGDLDHHLHKKDVALTLTWPTRYKIVKGVGSALFYLHHECEPYILHRDIKPGNILLDEDYNAKIADFGLSRIANKNKSTLVTTAIGTKEYMDPKLKIDGDVMFNRSSDIYSFGLVLLEIACGRHNSRNEVWSLYERSAPKLDVEAFADERLGGDFNMEQMERVLVVGLWCSLPDSAERPSMREAVRLLERDELPNLTSSPTFPCL